MSQMGPITDREVEALARLLCEEMGGNPDATTGQTLRQAQLDGRKVPLRKPHWRDYHGRAQMMLAERRAMARFLGGAPHA